MPFAKPCFKRFLHVRSMRPNASQCEQTIGVHYGRERGVMLEDVDETQMRLLSLLDGQHSFADIVRVLQDQDSRVTASDVSEALDDLQRFGLLEDAAVSPPSDLLSSDLERYASQIHFLSLLDTTGTQKYALQVKLKQARVAVLGLGGLGSNVLLGLAAIGVGFLRGVDCDCVEIGNLNRQVLYDVADLGKPKAEAAAEHLARFNPDVMFEPVQRRITGPHEIMDLIDGVDLVAFCADEPREIAMWMNQAALEKGIPFVLGGYHGAGAEVGPFVIPFQTGCLACEQAGNDPDNGTIAELTWIEQATRIRHPNVHFVTALAAHLTCSEICKYLLEIREPATSNRRYILDIEQFTLTASEFPRSLECCMCGQGKSNPRW